jgi:hypothetical protein
VRAKTVAPCASSGELSQASRSRTSISATPGSYGAPIADSWPCRAASSGATSSSRRRGRSNACRGRSGESSGSHGRRTGERSGLRSAIVRATHLVERACPPPAGLVSALGRLRPDVVVVTPMIYPASREIDVVKAAASTGIPSVGIVLSWDNLSTKGSFHALPDELIVWNDGQPGRPRAPFVRSHPTTSARPRSSARSSSPSSVRVASIDPPPAPPTSSPRPRAHHSRRWRRQRRRLPSGQAPEARTFDDRSVSP